MKKYTTEQLSRILSCSASGELGEFYDNDRRNTNCVEQAAHATWGIAVFDDNRIVDARADIWDNRKKIGFKAGDRKDPVLVLRFLESMKLA